VADITGLLIKAKRESDYVLLIKLITGPVFADTEAF
jgi:hypothetical protein